MVNDFHKSIVVMVPSISDVCYGMADGAAVH